MIQKNSIIRFLLLVIMLTGASVTLKAIPGPVVFFTDFSESPGSVYYYSQGAEYPLYQASNGNLSYTAFGQDGVMYYSNANSTKIYRVRNGQAQEIFNHSTYVRDIAVDAQGRLYFSESSGSAADGIIYRLEDGTAKVYFRVVLTSVNGYWSGNFAFGPDGSIYLSTGNVVNSYIYKVVSKIPTAVYHDTTGCISGFDLDSDGIVYYADWGTHIYKLDLSTGTRTSYYGNRGRHFADASLLKAYLSWGPEAGRVNRIGVHPTNPQIVYAGTSSGGVFRSYDAGVNWFSCGPGITDPEIGGILVYPPGPIIIIVVTPSGIFRSANSGATWSHVLVCERNLIPFGLIPSSVYEMQKSPIRFNSSTNTIYAAPFGAGLYQSTNGGVTWTSIYGDPNDVRTRVIMDIEVSGENGGTVFITTLQGLKKYNGGTWTSYGTEIASQSYLVNLRPVCIRVSPSNPERIYVTVSDLDHAPLETDVWRRDTYNGLFAKTTIGTPPFPSWSYLWGLEIDPDNADRLWIGGVVPYVSIDKGATWAEFYTTYGGCSNSTVCGADFRDVVLNCSKDKLYAAHDQGIASIDLTNNTASSAENGLINTQIYEMDRGPAGTLYMGTQDTGGFMKQTSGVLTNYASNTGCLDVINVLAHPSNDSISFAKTCTPDLCKFINYGASYTTSTGLPSTGFLNHLLAYSTLSNIFYAGTISDKIYKSTDGGSSFSAASSGITAYLPTRCIGIHPTNGNTAYAAFYTQGLYKTTNGGSNWQQLTGFPSQFFIPPAINAANCVLVIKPLSDGNTVYIGATGGVFLTTDGGTTWVERNNGLPERKVVSELVQDPTCSDCFYAGLGFYNATGLYGGGIYRTTDGGLNWEPFPNDKLKHLSITSIRFDAQNSNIIWVSTYGSGLFCLFKDNQ